MFGVVPIKERLEQLAEAYGDRFRPAPLIEKMARRNAHFHRGAA